MITFICDWAKGRIPDWVKDRQSFRRWTGTEDCPEKLRPCWFDGDVWIYLELEGIAHNAVKSEVLAVLRR